MKSKIVNQKELSEIVKELKSLGKTVVFTSGCFDIIHAGHVNYLEEASAMGDVLIILLNSDLSVKRLKGAMRPIVTETERAVVLAGLESVSYVCIFDESTPCTLIEKMEPDIVIKGGDYAGKWIPEMDSVSKYGGCVKYVNMTEGCSTTNIVEKIQNLYTADGMED